ncbi:AbrB family transcriptional regulator [Bacillaceae bacterium SIJ1]|uniref:AbrB family transcriptional regulator n=1 Tax=Litoribacterium kuwaitense TaxID=1398745 RepID=UPI0013EB4441|nr:AbrB family transcriptional regulator [Litoribacterium kuwaitense]NGP46485.1 AbrB family transcriptional regulator [Litoribacterium kuwaitense]
MKQRFIPYIDTLLVALAGGFLFQWLHIVLPWLLGPLVAAMLWRTAFNHQARWPTIARNSGMMILGYTLGVPFTANTFMLMVNDLPLMLVTTVLLIAFTIGIAVVLARWTALSFNSAVVGSIPGGLSQMALLSEEIQKTDPGAVTVMQTIRVLLVVSVVPFLAIYQLNDGSIRIGDSLDNVVATDWMTVIWLWPLILLMVFIAKRLRFPVYPLLGSLIATAIWAATLGSPPSFPNWIVNGAQLLLGAHLGLQFNLSTLAALKQHIWLFVIANLALIFFSLGLAALWSWSSHTDILTAFLSLAPGGVAEMGVTALAVGAHLPTVTSFQLFRVLFILLCLPPFLKWWLTYREQQQMRRHSTKHTT